MDWEQPFALGQGIVVGTVVDRIPAGVNNVHKMRFPRAPRGEGHAAICHDGGIDEQPIGGIVFPVSIVYDSVCAAVAGNGAACGGQGAVPVGELDVGKGGALGGCDAQENPDDVSVGLYGFELHSVTILGCLLGNLRLCVHVRLGGKLGLDGEINAVGYHFNLPVGHVLIFRGDHPAVLAEELDIDVELEAHQCLAPVTENVAKLLTGRLENQDGTPGGGGVVPLHPVAGVYEGYIITTKTVQSIPARDAGGIYDLVALVFREGKAHVQPEIAAVVAAAPADLRAEGLPGLGKPLYSQRIAEIPGGAEAQKIPRRLQVILLRQLGGFGIHGVGVGIPEILRQSPCLDHLLHIPVVFFLECVVIRAGLVGIGALQAGEGQNVGGNGVGIFLIHAVYQGVVPLPGAFPNFHPVHAQHIVGGAPHQQRGQGNHCRNQPDSFPSGCPFPHRRLLHARQKFCVYAGKTLKKLHRCHCNPSCLSVLARFFRVLCKMYFT